MNRYGVCRYNFNNYEPKITDLEIYDTYDEACDRYMNILRAHDDYSIYKNRDLWVIFIDERGRIVQFEQLMWKTKCKLVELENNENT